LRIYSSIGSSSSCSGGGENPDCKLRAWTGVIKNRIAAAFAATTESRTFAFIFYRIRKRYEYIAIRARSSIINVTDDSFEYDVIKSTMPGLVLFWAPWSSPSRSVASLLEEIAPTYASKPKIYRLNIANNPVFPREHSITLIPSLKLYRGGDEVGSLDGVPRKSSLINFLDGLL
jgi:thioredoxin 1